MLIRPANGSDCDYRARGFAALGASLEAAWARLGYSSHRVFSAKEL